MKINNIVFLEIKVEDSPLTTISGGIIDYAFTNIDHIKGIDVHQAVSVADSSPDWEQYIYSLMGWCMDHMDITDENSQVPTYEEWKNEKNKTRRNKNDL